MSGLPIAITELFFGRTSEKNDEGMINILRKLQKYVGIAVQLYDAANKNKSNVIKQEIEAGDVPSKCIKLDQSNELITSEDECYEKTDYEKSQTGLLM